MRCVPTLFLIALICALIQYVHAEAECEAHPLHMDSTYTLTSPWVKGDGSANRTYTPNWSHSIFRDTPDTESGTGKFFVCASLSGDETCCDYGTYVEIKSQILDFHELFLNATLFDLNEYTTMFNDGLTTLGNTVLGVINTIVTAADLTYSNSISLDINEIASWVGYFLAFMNRLFSTTYEVVGNAAGCLDGFMKFYAGMWCLACNQDYSRYMDGDNVRIRNGSAVEMGTQCGSPIVTPLVSVVDDFAEMIISKLPAGSTAIDFLEECRTLLSGEVTEIAAAIVGALTSVKLPDNLGANDLSFLVKTKSQLTMEEFGPFSIGVFLYGVMKWVDDTVLFFVPDEQKRANGVSMSSYTYTDPDTGEVVTLDAHPLAIDDEDVDPLFRDHPFGAFHTLVYNSAISLLVHTTAEERYELDEDLEDSIERLMDVLNVSDLKLQSDIKDKTMSINVTGVFADDNPNPIGIVECEEDDAQCEYYDPLVVGGATGYYGEYVAPTTDRDLQFGGSTTESSTEASPIGTEALAVVGVLFMFMYSVQHGRKSAIKAAAQNKKKKGVSGKSKMDELIDKRKKTKLSAEAKKNLIAPTSAMGSFEDFMEKCGGTVSKNGKVELISAEAKKPTRSGSTGVPRPSAASTERIDYMKNHLAQDKKLTKVRAY